MKGRVVISNVSPDTYVEYTPRGLTVHGEFDVVTEDTTTYVQVSFELNGYRGYGSAGKLYTYVDPGLDLKVGDLVNVPTVHEDSNVAIVRKLGDGYQGRAKREVNARYAAVPKPYDPADDFLDDLDRPF